jgi:hypothetical protein
MPAPPKYGRRSGIDPLVAAIVAAIADTLRYSCEAETFIACSSKYSVSHFIDCGAIAHRLCALPIASGNAANEMERTTT